VGWAHHITPTIPSTSTSSDTQLTPLLADYDDIQDSWASVSDIINKWRRTDPNDPFVTVAQPGAWNDPDMLMVGNTGLSIAEERSQFAIWSILAAPLMMSNDLATVSDESKAILLNREIIEVDQDSLGKQGMQVASSDSEYVGGGE
jgi:alpha-N-acetylgalactosaminidase